MVRCCSSSIPGHLNTNCDWKRCCIGAPQQGFERHARSALCHDSSLKRCAPTVVPNFSPARAKIAGSGLTEPDGRINGLQTCQAGTFNREPPVPLFHFARRELQGDSPREPGEVEQGGWRTYPAGAMPMPTRALHDRNREAGALLPSMPSHGRTGVNGLQATARAGFIALPSTGGISNVATGTAEDHMRSTEVSGHGEPSFFTVHFAYI